MVIVFRLMAGVNDFFSMTKRERRGTIVVLLVVVLLLAISYIIKLPKSVEVNEVTVSDVRAFESEVDSARVAIDDAMTIKASHKKKASKHREKRRKSSGKKKSKSHPQRNVDPLPQF